MLISDSIAKMIEEMLNAADGKLELKRNDLAEKIGCVPSQINYVITSRFTPQKGYIIESRRGGGGYIRIERVHMTRDEYLMHFFYGIGEELDRRSGLAFIRNLYDEGFVSEREMNICCSALASEMPDKIRADILRQIILALMK